MQQLSGHVNIQVHKYRTPHKDIYTYLATAAFTLFLHHRLRCCSCVVYEAVYEADLLNKLRLRRGIPCQLVAQSSVRLRVRSHSTAPYSAYSPPSSSAHSPVASSRCHASRAPRASSLSLAVPRRGEVHGEEEELQPRLLRLRSLGQCALG